MYMANTKNVALGLQRNLYSTDSRWGLAWGVTQFLGLALGESQMLAFLDTKAKVWHWWSKPTPGPNANGFASQNIGLRHL